MTAPTNPGDAIARAAARIQSTKDSARELSKRIAEERAAPPETERLATNEPTP